MKQLFKNNPRQTLLIFTTMEDAAYVFAPRENSMDLLDREMKLKSKEMSFEKIEKFKTKNQGGMTSLEKEKYYKIKPKSTRTRG